MGLGSIRETTPHIFERPVLTVEPHDSLLKAATFLAIGPQIYADGLVVVEGESPVGRIGSRHVIKRVFESKDKVDWDTVPVSRVMDSSVCGIDAGSDLEYALDVFANTRFAFVPITIDYKVASSLSVRDIQRFVISHPAGTNEAKLDGPAINFASSIVVLEQDASIGQILSTMISNNIRNVCVKSSSKKGGDKMRVINDRKLLELLISHQGRKVISELGIKGFYDIGVSSIDLHLAQSIEPYLSARRAAGLMSDPCSPCLLIKSRDDSNSTHIITPWDIVMKACYHV